MAAQIARGLYLILAVVGLALAGLFKFVENDPALAAWYLAWSVGMYVFSQEWK